MPQTSGPSPGPLHERLAQLSGVWTGAGEIDPNPWGPSGPTTGEWRFRRDAGGFNLIHDYSELRAGGFRFELHGVLTVDPDRDEVLWFAFDTFGFPPLDPSRGQWEGDRLVLRKTTPRGVGLAIFELQPDRLIYTVSARQAGDADFSRVARGEYAREPAR